MRASWESSPSDFSIDAEWRTRFIYILYGLVALGASAVAFSRSVTGTLVLLGGLAALTLVAVIVWRPVLGLYAAVFLNIAMEPGIDGDPITKYTDYFHLDINTFAHAGIAFSPIELLLILTTLAFIVRAMVTGKRVTSSTLWPHVLVFGIFLVLGYGWGVATGGDAKIGLFEARGPFMLVLLYFLVTNLVVNRQQGERIVALIVCATGALAVDGVMRFAVYFHGHVSGPDDPFGRVHEDAIFFGLLACVCMLRFVFGGTARQKVILLMLLPPAIFVMFEMQRRSAYFCLYFALIGAALALYARRRRLFYALAPVAILLSIGYGTLFWNSSSVLAEPIRAWKSQSTSSSLGDRDYSSNLYRVAEKASVRDTILAGPVLGIGFGHRFAATHPLVFLPWWPFQYYTPHAEVLWIWLKIGAGGFVAFWVLICTALLRAGDLIRRLGTESVGFACLVATTYLVMILVFAYVDVGLANARSEILLGTMLGIIGVAPKLMATPSRTVASAIPITAEPVGSVP